jgi:NADH-quinone oxidoreductase subunit J
MLVYGGCFLFFSLIMIISAIIVVSHRNQVIAALNLILCFFASAGLFMLLGAEFIAMSVVVVYVGAVAVLFLFVVMMLDFNQNAKEQSSSVKYIMFSCVLGCVLFVDLYLVFNLSISKENLPVLAKLPLVASENNIRAIGKVLYTDYSIAFICSGVILLVAMLGSIVLTLKSGASLHTKKQNINEQLARNKENGLRLVKVEFKKGIK